MMSSWGLLRDLPHLVLHWNRMSLQSGLVTSLMDCSPGMLVLLFSAGGVCLFPCRHPDRRSRFHSRLEARPVALLSRSGRF